MNLPFFSFLPQDTIKKVLANLKAVTIMGAKKEMQSAFGAEEGGAINDGAVRVCLVRELCLYELCLCELCL